MKFLSLLLLLATFAHADTLSDGTIKGASTGAKIGNVADALKVNVVNASSSTVTQGPGGLSSWLTHVDQIYNLACPASPKHYQADPIQTTRTCVLGALNVLELARRTGAKVLQASTSEVYGDPTVHPQPEEYRGNVNPIGPRACYDEGKRCAESLFFDYHRQYGVRIAVARIFNTYGPRMRIDDGRVVSNFIVQALRGEPLTVYGTGNQTRAFCYVDDMVDGLVRLMNADVTGPVNLGSPVETTMADLAKKVQAATGKLAPVIRADLPVDDPHRRTPDIRVAERVLGWHPAVGLDEGLRRTAAYFRAELEAMA